MKQSRFNSTEYSPNNISFRVITSKLLADVKVYQAYVLSQVEHSEYEFTRTSKEIAILHSQRLYKWLEAIETHMIASGSYKVASKDDLLEILESSSSLFDTLKTIVTREEVFANQAIVEKYIFFLNESERKIAEILALNETDTIGAVLFSKLAAHAHATLSLLRLALYEADKLSKDNTQPFICINDVLANDIMHWLDFIEAKKAEYAKGRQGVPVTFKNFCSSETVFEKILTLIK